MVRSGRSLNLIPADVLDRFKWEVAGELGLTDKVKSRGWSEMPTRDCGAVGGRIGGNMVRVMCRYAEEALATGEEVE